MPSRYGLEIRAANAADAVGIALLMKAAGAVADTRSLAERIDGAHSEPGIILVASEWGPPSGVIAVSWMRTLAEAQRVAVISTILVDPDARRRGIGRLMLKTASQAARTAGCDVMRSLTASDHAGLDDFYAATGFAEEGRVFARSLRRRS